MCQISKKIFCLSFKLKKKLKKSENLFCAQKPPIFGTKVDFFPLSEKKSKNFPNTKKNILAELHFKKIKKKIRETFLFTHSVVITRFARSVLGLGRRRQAHTASAHFSLDAEDLLYRTCKTSSGGIPAQNVQDQLGWNSSTERARLARVESQHRTCKTRWGRRSKGNPL